LGIETSCDETACAVVVDGRDVISNVVCSQVGDHAKYGGVFPELASRRQIEEIVAVYEGALGQASLDLKDIDVVAVTFGPGLVGSLLVGVNFAKALAFYSGIPLVAVDHIKGHIASNYITHRDLEPPFLCLTVSGGHTQIVHVLSYEKCEIIGSSRDDAAGEAFDKVGRALGLGYPAGVKIDLLAREGDSERYKFPHPKVKGAEFDFSFSGLKTAVINMLHNTRQSGGEVNVQDVAASFQSTVVSILLERLIGAARKWGCSRLCLAGGVSANSELRERASLECANYGFELFYPASEYCGDNAAMIASEGYYEFMLGNLAGFDLNP
jgi:N6-L-threonylcarbamoyladenine synthase